MCIWLLRSSPPKRPRGRGARLASFAGLLPPSNLRVGARHRARAARSVPCLRASSRPDGDHRASRRRLVWRCGLQSAFRLISPPAALGAAKKTPIPSPLCSRGPRAGARRDLLRLSPCLELRPAFQMKMWRISVILSVIPCSFSWRYTRQMSPRRVPRQVPAAFFCSGTRGRGTLAESRGTDTHPAGV